MYHKYRRFFLAWGSPNTVLKHCQCSKTEPLFPPIPLRDEKVKVLKAVPELSLSDVVLGQVGFFLSYRLWLPIGQHCNVNML